MCKHCDCFEEVQKHMRVFDAPSSPYEKKLIQAEKSLSILNRCIEGGHDDIRSRNLRVTVLDNLRHAIEHELNQVSPTILGLHFVDRLLEIVEEDGYWPGEKCSWINDARNQLEKLVGRNPDVQALRNRKINLILKELSEGVTETEIVGKHRMIQMTDVNAVIRALAEIAAHE